MGQAIRQVMIRGRVQGVGYRAWVVQQATGRQLEGWVRNRRDGCVEVLFAGPPDVVTELVTLCRRGPSSARVTTVHEEDGHPDALGLRQSGERFSVLSTI